LSKSSIEGAKNSRDYFFYWLVYNKSILKEFKISEAEIIMPGGYMKIESKLFGGSKTE
jgi:hypothetical protein